MELARPISVAVACDPSQAGLFSILELKSSEGLKSSPDPGKTVLIVPDSDMAFNHWTTDFVFPLFCVFVLLFISIQQPSSRPCLFTNRRDDVWKSLMRF